MEQWVLGMLQEQLGKYIVGFRKEMVNASLLNGKGEITDLNLNCAAINMQLSSLVPFIELESIHISKVAFQVTSWTNLRKSPIMVDIEHITIHITEPLHYLFPRKRRRIRQMTVAEMTQHFKEKEAEAKANKTAFSNPNKRGGYGLGDRIADNLTIEIKSIYVQFQTWGKFKTRRPGPWTPPTLQFMLRNLRYVSVDEFGQEGSPDDVWSHNHKPQPRGEEKTLLVFKKVSMDYDFGVKTVYDGDDDENDKNDDDDGKGEQKNDGINDKKGKRKGGGGKHYSLLKGGRGCQPIAGPAAVKQPVSKSPPPPAESPTAAEVVAALANTTGPLTVSLHDTPEHAAEVVAALAGPFESSEPPRIPIAPPKPSDPPTILNTTSTTKDENRNDKKEEDPDDKKDEDPNDTEDEAPNDAKDETQNDAQDKNNDDKNKEDNADNPTTADANGNGDGDADDKKQQQKQNEPPKQNEENALSNATSKWNAMASNSTTWFKSVSSSLAESTVAATRSITTNSTMNSTAADAETREEKKEETANSPKNNSSDAATDPEDDFNNKVVVHIAMKRRIRDGALLALQLDNTISKVEMLIPSEVVPLLAHVAVGLQYCFCKDRGFEDPLRSKNDRSDHNDASARNFKAANLPGSKKEMEKEEGKEPDETGAESNNETKNENNNENNQAGPIEASSEEKEASPVVEASADKASAAPVETGASEPETKDAGKQADSTEVIPVVDVAPTVKTGGGGGSVASGLDNMSLNMSLAGDGFSVLADSIAGATETDTVEGSTVTQLEQKADASQGFSKRFSSLFSRPPTLAATPEKGGKSAPGTPAKDTNTPKVISGGVNEDRAVIMLPNGLIIHEKISVSVSIDRAVVRGLYPSKGQKSAAPTGEDARKCNSDNDEQKVDSTHQRLDTDDYFQANSSGVVMEMIWPKADMRKGGYAQVSVSHMTVQERFGKRIRTLVSGGVKEDPLSSPIEKPAQPPIEVSDDVSFPMFKDRAIREDPLDIRHTFPAQAVGLLSTIDCQTRKKKPPAISSITPPLPTTIITNDDQDEAVTKASDGDTGEHFANNDKEKIVSDENSANDDQKKTASDEAKEIEQPESEQSEKDAPADQPKEADTATKVSEEDTLGRADPAKEADDVRTKDTSVHVTTKEPDELVNVIMFSSDVGVDRFNVVVDCDSWCRVLRFFLNEGGGGFDARWFSGDWADCFTTDMLVHPNDRLELDDHLQPSKLFYLDENEFISSDLLHVNARISNCEMCLPAAIQQNVRSCDIVVNVGETFLSVSSELPRTFLSGKIGSVFCGDKSMAAEEEEKIRFPNDPSDVSVELERGEDPARRQSFIMKEETSEIVKSKSTFRSQVKLRGLSTQIVPVIPFYVHLEPQHLCAPTEMTIGFSFEGEPPESVESNLVKMVLNASILVDRIKMNCDLDLLAGAVSTCLHHYQVVEHTIEQAKVLIPSFDSPPNVPEDDASMSMSTIDDISSANSIRIKKTLHGRRALVHRQFHRSRETGGLRIASYIRVGNYSFTLWRQNVSMYSPLRPSAGFVDVVERQKLHFPLLKLLTLETRGLEVGVEVAFQEQDRRVVLKSSISELRISLCNLERQAANGVEGVDLNGPENEKKSQDETEEETGDEIDQVASEAEINDEAPKEDLSMVDLLHFGCNVPMQQSPASESSRRDKSILLRCEERFGTQRSRSLAADMGTGGVVTLHVDHMENVFLLLLEALMMPTWSRKVLFLEQEQSGFPDRSIGALFLSLIPLPGSEFAGFASLLGPAISLVMPEDLRLFLLRTRMSDILITVPEVKGHSQGTLNVTKCALMLRHFELQTWYISSEDVIKRHVLSTLAKDGATWLSLIPKESKGLNHRITARQSFQLAQFLGSKEGELVVADLVPEFEVTVECLQSKIATAIENTLSFHDSQRFQDSFRFLRRFAQRCLAIFLHLRQRLTILREFQQVNGEIESKEEMKSIDKADPVGQACSDMELSVRAAKDCLVRMCQLFEDSLRDHKALLSEKDNLQQHLQRQVFIKERERIAAITLASSPLAGWLRMGGTHQSGQRVATTSTLWRYWAVLRKDLLIFYAGPGKYKPIDIVSLQGARLRLLAGGRSKWDLKRAFGVVERSGKTRFLVAETEAEYIGWTKEIDKVVTYYQIIEIEKPTPIDANNDLNVQALSDRDEESVGMESTGLKTTDSVQSDPDPAIEKSTSRGTQIRGKLAGIGSVLKRSKDNSPKGAASMDSVLSGSSDGDNVEEVTFSTDTLDDQESVSSNKVGPSLAQGEAKPNTSNEAQEESPGGGGRRVQLRGKVSGVGQATNRWGSALFAATKKKGREVAEKARRGSASTPLSKAEKHASSSDLHVISETVERNWICPKCTYLNSTKDSDLEVLVCEICESPTEVSMLEFDTPPTDSVVVDASSPGSPEGNIESNAAELGTGATDPNGVQPSAPNSDKGIFRRSQSSGESGLRDRVDSTDSDKMAYRRSQSSGSFGFADDDEASVVSDLAMDELSEATGKRSRRGIGAALGGARRSRQNQPPEPESKGWLARLGSNLSSKDESDSIQKNQVGLKIKNLRVDPSVDLATERSIAEVNTPLKMLNGRWFVLVTPLRPGSFTGEINIPTALAEGVVGKPPDNSSDPTVDGSEAKVSLNSEDNTQDNSASPKLTVDTESVTEQKAAIATGRSAHSTQTKAKTASSNEQCFSIQLFNQSYSENGRKHPQVEVVRGLSEIVSCHAEISECIADLLHHPCFTKTSMARTPSGDMSNGLKNAMGVSAVDSVRVSGTMLAGVLDALAAIETPPSFIADSVAEFLNSSLECPLPNSCLFALMSLFSISDMPSHVVWSPSDDTVDDPELEARLSRSPMSNGETLDATERPDATNMPYDDLMALSSRCVSELTQAEQSGRLAGELLDVAANNYAVLSAPTFFEPLLPTHATDHLQEAMHAALTKVMAERDEAHAQLVSTSVLHAHTVEQEKKKVDRLTEKLEIAQKQQLKNIPLFQKKKAEEEKEQREKWEKKELEMQQNSDAEIVALCEQLSGEISSRTKAALEVIRLKESRSVERQHETEEKDAIKSELIRVKELLALEQKKAQEAQSEAEKWKQYYETLMTETKNGDHAGPH